MIKKVFFIISILSIQTCFAYKNEDVIKAQSRVAAMVEQDQKMRYEILNLMKQKSVVELGQSGYFNKLNKIDIENSHEIKKLLNKWGWPKREIFGKKYCQEFWLLVQHADHEIELQKLALTKLTKILETDKNEATHFAYLWDRVKMNQHLPQRYGTQGTCINKHYWQPIKIEDEINLNKRRYSVGLDSMENYKKTMNEFCP